MVMVRLGYKNSSSSPSGGIHFICGNSVALWSSSSSSSGTEYLASLILAMETWLHFDLQASEGNRPAALPCSEAPAPAWLLALHCACQVHVCGAILCLPRASEVQHEAHTRLTSLGSSRVADSVIMYSGALAISSLSMEAIRLVACPAWMPTSSTTFSLGEQRTCISASSVSCRCSERDPGDQPL